MAPNFQSVLRQSCCQDKAKGKNWKFAAFHLISSKCEPAFQKLIFCNNTDKIVTNSKRKIVKFELQYNGKT